MTWFSPDVPIRTYDVTRARALLASLGLVDRDGDGMLETAAGAPVRFSMLSQAGHIRGRTAAAMKSQLQQIGVGVDLVTLDPGGIVKRFGAGDYDSIYFGIQASSTDPSLNLDLWLSSGEKPFLESRPAGTSDGMGETDRRADAGTVAGPRSRAAQAGVRRRAAHPRRGAAHHLFRRAASDDCHDAARARPHAGSPAPATAVERRHTRVGDSRRGNFVGSFGRKRKRAARLRSVRAGSRRPGRAVRPGCFVRGAPPHAAGTRRSPLRPGRRPRHRSGGASPARARPSSRGAVRVVGRPGRPAGFRQLSEVPTSGFDARRGACGEHDDSRRLRPRPGDRDRDDRGNARRGGSGWVAA